VLLAKVDRLANRLYVLRVEHRKAGLFCHARNKCDLALTRTIRASELPWAPTTGGRGIGGWIATN
jgi:hypothetical protein